MLIGTCHIIMIQNKKLSIIGQGYIGLPLSISFSKKFHVIGYDVDKIRINELKKGYDKNYEFKKREIFNKRLNFSFDEKKIINTDYFIVTVPTPVKKNNLPDLNYLNKACTLIGKYIKKNCIVIFESTVFPGCTEEFCVPIISKISKLKPNKDFFYGYSPERINVGDKKRSLPKIEKLVSGSDNETLNKIYKLYKSIIKTKVHKVPNIKTAEAAKIIENTQRDLNIALINEFSLICKKLKINTNQVLKYAATKWNFVKFKPGLVGGHCIGVDPYYLTYKAKKLGLKPNVILAGRKINNSMGAEIGKEIIKLVKEKLPVKKIKILIAGFSFKENCSDFRNTKVIDLFNFFKKKKLNAEIYDPWCDRSEIKKVFGIDIHNNLKTKKKYDVLVFAVPHKIFLDTGLDVFLKKLNRNNIVYDVKELFHKDKRVTSSL